MPDIVPDGEARWFPRANLVARTTEKIPWSTSADPITNAVTTGPTSGSNPQTHGNRRVNMIARPRSSAASETPTESRVRFKTFRVTFTS